jgi:hypothetical protein
MFFRTKFGARETYTVHRGCLIVRNTVTFTGQLPTRRTAVYLVTDSLEGHPDTFCVQPGSEHLTVRQAKKFLDQILDRGVYERVTVPLQRR